ncbi:GFA family protein [Sphingomonas sp. ID0503]|uniref:GFA family protein n=1 Tax=Sphingomonas sp. ID0503 TaxID=3399691 RepID=UPI003AFB7EE4
MTMTGQCLCGQVKYEVASEPFATAICHCRNCQKQAGSAFSIVVAVPSKAVTRTGELKIYDDKADSGATLHRQFCPECGSPIFSVLAEAPQVTIVKAGTLDDVSSLQPQFHVWCKSAQPWVALDPAMPQFQENAPVPGA